MEKKPTYEEAFEGLENILKELESGKVSLDRSLELYEKGIALYRQCNSLIDEAQLKIKKFNEENMATDFDVE